MEGGEVAGADAAIAVEEGSVHVDRDHARWHGFRVGDFGRGWVLCGGLDLGGLSFRGILTMALAWLGWGDACYCVS